MQDAGSQRSAEGSGLGKQIAISFFLFICATLLPGLLFGGSQFFSALFDRSRPEVNFIDPPSGIGIEPATLTFEIFDKGAGLSEVFVRGVENQTARQLFHRKYPDNSLVANDTISISFDGKNSGYMEGHTSLLVSVVDRSLWKNKSVTSLLLKVDYEPPSIKLLSTELTGAPGSAQLVFFKIRDPQIGFSGVRSGASVFPGYPAKELDKAFAETEDVYFSFFPISLNCEQVSCDPELLAVDSVGNQAVSELHFRNRSQKYKTRKIALKGEVILTRINRLYLEYLQRLQIGLDDSVDISSAAEQFAYRFQKLNEVYRESLDRELRKKLEKTKLNRLWRGPFLGFAGELVTSFGDRQHWALNGLDAGRDRSRGITWTNLKDDQIRAANTGKVVFVGAMGVYGNTVVIDHGFGLSSLYAHLGSISCIVGQRVSKSTVIGQAGSSGLVDQKSLHFQLRLHGVPVNPEPWWSTAWVRREVDRKLSTLKRQLGISGLIGFDDFGF